MQVFDIESSLQQTPKKTSHNPLSTTADNLPLVIFLGQEPEHNDGNDNPDLHICTFPQYNIIEDLDGLNFEADCFC